MPACRATRATVWFHLAAIIVVMVAVRFDPAAGCRAGDGVCSSREELVAAVNYHTGTNGPNRELPAIGEWDVSRVNSMNQLFSDKGNFNDDISG